MRRGKRAAARRRWPLILLLAVLALLAALFFLRGRTTPEPPAPVEEDSPAQIAIPGYEALTLQAGAKSSPSACPTLQKTIAIFRFPCTWRMIPSFGSRTS